MGGEQAKLPRPPITIPRVIFSEQQVPGGELEAAHVATRRRICGNIWQFESLP
eukprot:COSAG06_NODE_1612_length_8935_cov_5.449411_1_plen_53_part_00